MGEEGREERARMADRLTVLLLRPLPLLRGQIRYDAQGLPGWWG